MFEKYTETARRVIFFARYEASQLGSKYIDTEHLLLGVLREDRPLALRLLKSPEKIKSIRERIEKGYSRPEKVSTSVDLPLSRECKRVLAFGAEEAQRLNKDHITPEHFLLGLLHETECVAAKIMLENGLTASHVEANALDVTAAAPSAAPPVVSPLPEGWRDLTAEAMEDAPISLIGREGELERIIQILSRRTRNNAVLIGDPGVGKNVLVHGLAKRIADGAVAGRLADRPILAIEASSLLSSRQGGKLPGSTTRQNAILYVQGLFDLAGKGGGWGVLEAMRALEPYLSPGGLQCIATGTPIGFRLTLERAESLVRLFEVVPVPAPGEEEAIRIVKGVKAQYEKFHGVVITDEAIETAVLASRWFLRQRHLPDRAIDLIDEAGARVKLRYQGEPREVFETRKRLNVITRELETAIATHEFQKAREYSDRERKERQSLESLLEKTKSTPRTNVVHPDDILETVATRANVPVSAVVSVLELKEPEQLELVARELAAQIPIGGREWAEELATYLAGCSVEEAEKVALAIRTAKTRLDSQQSGNKMGSGA